MSGPSASPNELSPQEKRALLEKLLKEKAAQSNSAQGAAKSTHVPIQRLSRDQKYFRLSTPQQRLWLLDQLDAGNPAYNISVLLRFKGALDVSALKQALDTIQNRHEILQVNFTTVDGSPVQFIVPDRGFAFQVVDVSGDANISAIEKAQQLAEQDAQRSFDLSQDPLARVNLFRVAEDDHFFEFVIHHIIFDGWSLGVFLKELTHLYTAILNKQVMELPPLEIQYIDFAEWESKESSEEQNKEHLEYWSKQLGGSLPVLDLPLDKPRPAVQSFRPGKEGFDLSPALTKSLNALSRQEGVTLFMTMLSVFYTLLERYSAQEDIIVGTPIARRSRAEVEKLLGVFLNNLALRTDLSGNISFRELLKRVRRTALDAFAHQEVPFERLLNELRIERDPSRTPVFQVFFNLIDIRKSATLELPHITVETPPPPEVGSLFDLTLYVQNLGEILRLKLVYNADLFSEERMAELLRQYHQLLELVVATPDESIQSYSLVTPQASQVLPNQHQPLKSEWFGSVQFALTETAQKFPDHIALVDRADQWTFDELEKRSNQLAHRLLQEGIQRNDIVAVYARRNASLVWALLGILKAGAAFLILDSSYPSGRLARYLSLAQPRGLINLESDAVLPDEMEQEIQALDAQFAVRINLDADSGQWLARYDDRNPGIESDPQDMAYIAFTSGSTDQPKGIIGTHRPLSHFFHWHTQTFGFNEKDRFSMLSGLAHDPLLRDIFTPLWVGATLHIPDQELMLTPGQLLSWVKENCISVMHLTPAIEELLIDTAAPSQGTNALEALRYAFFGGETLTRQHIQKLKRHAPTVTCVNFYGATETPQAMAYNFADETGLSEGLINLHGVIPLGCGIQDVQLLITNNTGTTAGIGELGEIQIRTPYLSQGYLKDAALTKTKFIVNPCTGDPADRIYRTGDLGRFLPDGKVEFVGRKDGQVKIRGFRIELGEIESLLSGHPDVHQSVVSVFEASGDKQLVAYIVPRSKDFSRTSELREYLQPQLPAYMIPSRFILLDAIPLTPNGKIDRRALPTPGLESRTHDHEQVAASSNTQEKLVKLWEELLHVQPIGIRDNFFELGGHSLLAVHMFSRINQEFGVNLPLATLFRAATIEHLAKTIDGKSTSLTWSSLIEIEPAGDHPPFFCVHGITGDILWFRELAHCLVPNYPFFGLQSRGLDGIQEPLTSIEEMAAHYVEEIRRLQPSGPYFLGGASFGGTVALEIAQQLIAQGQDVEMLAIFDHAPNINVSDSSSPFKKRLIRISRVIRNFPSWLWDFVQLGPSKMWSRIRRKLRIMRKVSGQAELPRLGELDAEDLIDFASELSPHRQQLISLNYQAIKKYVPRPYSGKVTLFRAMNRPLLNTRDPEPSWQLLSPGRVRTLNVPGSHEGMFKKPHVHHLAEKLRESMDRYSQ